MKQMVRRAAILLIFYKKDFFSRKRKKLLPHIFSSQVEKEDFFLPLSPSYKKLLFKLLIDKCPKMRLIIKFHFFVPGQKKKNIFV
ncbi:MAG: hypothetical protein D3908_15200 [Candidatus Electrothrix sp. AUS4]|nr:hypothetical protein [Candidatus Electrothrix sp. AUS4]